MRLLQTAIISILLFAANSPLLAAVDFNSGPYTLFRGANAVGFVGSGGTAPYTFSYTPGAIAIPGMRLEVAPNIPTNFSASTSGVLLGMLLNSGTYSTTIRVTDATSAFVDKVVTLNIQPFDFARFVPDQHGVGDTISFQLPAVGGTAPYTYAISAGALPGGLSLNAGTGIISGIATTAGSFSFTLKGTDATSAIVTRGYSMTIRPMRLNLASRILPNAVINQAYSFSIPVTGGTAPYTYALDTNNTLPTGLSLSSTGLLSGTVTFSTFGWGFTVKVTDAAANTSFYRFEISILNTTASLISIPTSFFDGTVGDEISTTLYPSGGTPPYSYAVEAGSSLPSGVALITDGSSPGLNYDPQPAYLRYRIYTPGTYSFQSRVTDSLGNFVVRPVTFNVAAVRFYIFPPSFPSSNSQTQGVPYSFQTFPIGGTPPYNFTGSRITYGLTLDNAGKITGTPQEAGPFVPFVTTLNDSASGFRFYNNSISVGPPGGANPMDCTGGDFGTVQLGVLLARNLNCTGVVGSVAPVEPITTSVVAGTLPPGIILIPDNTNTLQGGRLTGTPTTPGVYNFVVKYIDSVGSIGQKQIVLTVSPVNVLTGTLPNPTVGQPYSATILAGGGSGGYVFTLDSGYLPPTLTLNGATGVISGTPSVSEQLSFVVRVTDSNGKFLLRSFSLTVGSFDINSPLLLPSATGGRFYSYTFTTNPAGAYTWTTTSVLPTGLTLNAVTGVLSGTPLSNTGVSTFAITAGTATTAVTKIFTLHFITPQNAKLLSGLTAGPGGFIGDFFAGAQLNFTLGTSGGLPPYTATVAAGSLPPGVSIVVSNSFNVNNAAGRVTLLGVPTTVGSYTFTLNFMDSSGLSAKREYVLNIVDFALSLSTLPKGLLNVPYSFQLSVQGNATGCTYGAFATQNNVLSPGISLSPSGLLSGTPNSSGNYNTTLVLTCAGGKTRQAAMTLPVYTSNPTNRIDFGLGAAPVDLSLGRGVSFTFTPTGGSGTHTWSLVSGTLPPGMQLITTNLPSGLLPPQAILAGAPNTVGTYTFTIGVADSNGLTGQKTATHTVTPLLLGPQNRVYFATTALPTGQNGSSYSATLTGIGGRAPYTFAFAPGVFNSKGLTLSTSGVIGGTPVDTGATAINLVMTDADGKQLRTTAGINLYSGVATAINGSGGVTIPNATVTQPYTFNLTNLLLPTAGTSPFSFALDSGTLPAGLSLVGNGTANPSLSGTPTASGSHTFTLLGTDAAGTQMLSINSSINVSPIAIAPAFGTIPPATAGTPYTLTMTPAGGSAPYTFKMGVSSSLPAGLSLSTDGVLSGTPTSVGLHALFLDITDSTSTYFRQYYSITVNPVGAVIPALTVNPPSISLSYTTGNPTPAPIGISLGSTAGSFSFTSSNGGTPWISISPAAGTVPSSTSATINPSGLAAGVYNGAITFLAPSTSNAPVTVPVTLTVLAPAPCTYSLSANSSSILAAGGSGAFNVIASTPTCSWTASTAAPWITINGAGAGTGNGAISFVAAANPSSSPRTGTITVQGLTYTVTQFGLSCSFTLNPNSLTLTSVGGSGPIQVQASGSGCTWTASSPDAFVTLGSASGTGSAPVNVIVSVNPASASRASTVTIAGQPLSISQSGIGCTYSLTSTGSSVAFSGTVSPISVSMNTPVGCSWTTNPGPNWITVVSGSSGTGPGPIQLSVAANSSTSDRAASVLIGGQPFLITESSLPCSFSLSSDNPVQPAGGGSGTVGVTAAGSSCTWLASSNVPWITPSTSFGSGTGSLGFTVSANSNALARAGTLTVAGQNITVNQGGISCSYSLQSPSAVMPAIGASSAVGVLSASGCAWNASTSTPWITIPNPNGSGSQNLQFSVGANGTASDRAGTITIAGITFPVTQPAAPCTVTITSLSPLATGEFGISGSINFTTSVSGCPLTVQSNTSWLTVNSTSYAGTAGSVNFSTATNNLASVRSGTISINGSPFTVNQAASTCSYVLTSFGFMTNRTRGDGSIPINYSPLGCLAPTVVVTGPTGMITLGPVNNSVGPPASYTQLFSVNFFQSFLSFVRTAQLSVNGQNFIVKQSSF